ncbi:MAG: LLM class flavin-dependent oxidoreductase [Acetobacteraceae bacterium]|nr:LLM class flavin-dependent oxidoreductase [Acetobacteraceae bacterium]
MRFGLFGAAQAARGGPDVDSAAGFRDYIDYVIEAEALGYESAFMVEHHFTGFGQVSASLNLLTWIAAHTSTLRLGTAVLVLPWHNPVLLAEQAATLDLLSDGRLDFGIGRGYRHGEFSGFCIPIDEAQARFEESVDVITRAWTSESRFSHHGKFWQFENIIVEPPTKQKLHPPFWQGAGHASSIERVAARDHNLLIDQFCPLAVVGERLACYRDALVAHGHQYRPYRVGAARAFMVTNTQAEKDTALERRFLAQQRMASVSVDASGKNASSIMTFSDVREASAESAMYGTPDEIARKLETLQAMGVDYVLLNGGGTSRENLRRFAHEIMPAFRDQPALVSAQ